MITVRTPSGDKGAAALTLRTPSGDVGIARMTLRTPSGDELIFDGTAASALTVTASPFSATGSGASAADIDITTSLVTVSATGGTEPYTYAWADLGGDGTWSIQFPAAASTRFTAQDVPGGALYTRTFECTATDARGRTGSVIVGATAYNFGDIVL